MTQKQSTGRRATALAVAAVLITGGITGLTTAHDHAVTTIGSVVALLAGLLFLRIAARK